MGERLVIISQDQQLTDEDLTNIGKYAQGSLDHVVNDGIEPGRKFTGFAAVASGAAQVTVGAGRLYQGGEVFFRDDDGGVVLDLLTLLPSVTEKIVAIAVWGQTIQTNTVPRTFLVDIDTEQTEARATATEVRRFANVNSVNGVESADPVAPALDSNVLAVAYVRLNPSGVVSITPVDLNRLVSTRQVADRVTGLESWRDRAGTRLDTLDSTVAGIQGQLSRVAPANLVFEIARDTARLKELSELPETYSSYDADRYLTAAKSDTLNVNFLAKVEEGIHFPPAAQYGAQVDLLNPIEPLVSRQNNMVMPAYTEVIREKIVGKDSELSMAQFQYQTIETVLKDVARTRIRYGTSQTVCTNAAWWRSGTYDVVTNIFRRAGETWAVAAGDIGKTSINHQWIRVTQFFYDTYNETYWEATTVPQAVSASFMGETFLNSEPGFITGVGLFFTRRAETGDVSLMIVETEGGKPVYRKAIARVTLPVSDIKLWPEVTKIPLPPTFLEKGRRYAIVPATAGNHFLAAVNGDKNTNGTFFYSTDGDFSQGDLTKDIAYTLYYASFNSPRIEVQLNALQLNGGIASIDLNFDSLTPDGTEIAFEIQVNGVWKALGASNPDLLIGLPPLVPFRVVMLGTIDVMPGFGTGIRSYTLTSRPRADNKHISVARVLPAPCKTVTVTTRLEYWDAGHHTHACKLLTGAGFTTVVSPTTSADDATPDPAAIVRTYTFILPEAVSEFKIQQEGTTDNVLVTYHVAEQYNLSYAS